MPGSKTGDVNARTNVRADEVSESISLVRQAFSRFPEGEIRTDLGENTGTVTTKYEILVATDDSEYARKAEMSAMKIARSYNIRMAAIYIAVGSKDSEREERIAKGESEINPELGSVALAVVKKARCTVLVAR